MNKDTLYVCACVACEEINKSMLSGVERAEQMAPLVDLQSQGNTARKISANKNTHLGLTLYQSLYKS